MGTMLSIIICSRHKCIPLAIQQNIADSIGTEYEIITIDNSENRYSIFQAYNEGIRRAKGDILCFMHEDVLFRSNNWGIIIDNYFAKDILIGLIGFAGSHFLADTPMYWYSAPFVSQRNLNNDQGVVEEHFHEGWFGNKSIIEVVAVDGFCFYVRKSLFDRISFDEDTYNGFHLYDMDICMQVIEAGYKVCVARDVLTEHCWSESQQFTKQGGQLFNYNLKLFSKKWKDNLPIHKGLDLPQDVFTRVNDLFCQLYKANRTRHSKAYRLGKQMLKPINWIKRKIQ